LRLIKVKNSENIALYSKKWCRQNCYFKMSPLTSNENSKFIWGSTDFNWSIKPLVVLKIIKQVLVMNVYMVIDSSFT